MIYTFSEIKKIKQDIEWVIHECKTNPKLRQMRDNEAIIGLGQHLFAYENLLEDMGVNGTVDTEKDNLKGIDVTVDLIEKIKISISGIK
ncbi:hypothetical protein QM201_15015 [Enterobacter asburiae]|nr:hypothetical protein [Enterobacter asburiae]